MDILLLRRKASKASVSGLLRYEICYTAISLICDSIKFFIIIYLLEQLQLTVTIKFTLQLQKNGLQSTYLRITIYTLHTTNTLHYSQKKGL